MGHEIGAQEDLKKGLSSTDSEDEDIVLKQQQASAPEDEAMLLGKEPSETKHMEESSASQGRFDISGLTICKRNPGTVPQIMLFHVKFCIVFKLPFKLFTGQIT